MNVLMLRDSAVEFNGFDGLDDDSVIVVRILANKLVISGGNINTESGKLYIQLKNKKSNNPDLCALFQHYCGGKPTSFIVSKSDQPEYIQHLPVTDK